MTKREIAMVILGAILMALTWVAYQDHLKVDAMWTVMTTAKPGGQPPAAMTGQK